MARRGVKIGLPNHWVPRHEALLSGAARKRPPGQIDCALLTSCWRLSSVLGH